MWDVARILLGAHIDNFVIARANWQVLQQAFWKFLRARISGLYNTTVTSGEATWTSTTCLSQTHYAEEILRTYIFGTPRLTPMQPNTRLNKRNCDKNLAPDFHRRYRGIVGSLGCLATII